MILSYTTKGMRYNRRSCEEPDDWYVDAKKYWSSLRFQTSTRDENNGEFIKLLSILLIEFVLLKVNERTGLTKIMFKLFSADIPSILDLLFKRNFITSFCCRFLLVEYKLDWFFFFKTNIFYKYAQKFFFLPAYFTCFE